MEVTDQANRLLLMLETLREITKTGDINEAVRLAQVALDSVYELSAVTA